MLGQAVWILGKNVEFQKHVFPGLRKLSRGGKAGEGVPRVVGGAISMQVHPRSLPLHPGTRDTVTHPPMHIKHRSHLSFIFISWKNFRR